MSAAWAISLREAIELLPPVIFAIGLGVVCGIDSAPLSGLGWTDWSYFVPGALLIGLWQGALDRYHVADEFHRHRPVAASVVQSSRWLVGFLAVTFMFVAMLSARSITTAMMDEQLVDRIRTEAVAVGRHSAGNLVVCFCAAVLAWITLRITVSWRGVVAPVLLSILLPWAVAAGLLNAAPHVEILMIPGIVLFSVYQGVRLSEVRQ